MPTASIDRKRGGDLGVELRLDRKLAAPDLDAALVAELLGLVADEVALEVAAEHGVDQIAVADAIDRRSPRRSVLTLSTGMPRWPVRGST